MCEQICVQMTQHYMMFIIPWDRLKVTLQIALDNLHECCRENGMIINSSKTKVMLVATNQKRQRLENDKT